jgi:hypothetical protein
VIVIVTNDGCIRNVEQAVLDIVLTMQSDGYARITLCSEGPCCKHVGLYSLLDCICNQFNFNPQRISILTSNLLEAHPKYSIHRNFNFWELEHAVKNSKKFNTEKVFDAEFKHFGSFIGHSNKYRLQIGSELRANYADKTIQSYRCSVTDPYHRSYIGLEDLMFMGYDVDTAYNHIKSGPIELDDINSFPILQPANINILKYYPHLFVEIVNLTFFSGNTFYVDEKIWRPMLALTPFMVQGPANLIKNLRRIGFKTFHSWWDEGYSEDPDDCQVKCMFDNIQKLSHLSIWELEAMYNDMMPTLVHNRDLLLTLNKEQVEKVFNDK